MPNPLGTTRASPSLEAEETAASMRMRHDWTKQEVLTLLERPFHDLLADAHAVHRRGFWADEIERGGRTGPTDLRGCDARS